ncbi:hypothetical protein [Olsenella sp. HMSC062G07]|uniref:hypothetical protein n=1 Tax=Olsenella sp. HMSC062G07 TaxID=1739330 RepID=UPI0008A1881B|nr:hypothetical protein [Olsenella sp. HMSC062G07]OFK23024.1 hypothetical protein HMPREF2826_00075 [Olsenella sp. HMSC062G07]
MLVRDLIRQLEEFDEDEVVAVDVVFPQIDWAVRDYPLMVELNDDGQPALIVTVGEGQFDFPDVLQRLKARVDAIPEWAIHPVAHR